MEHFIHCFYSGRSKAALCLKEDVTPFLEVAHCKLSAEMRPG